MADYASLEPSDFQQALEQLSEFQLVSFLASLLQSSRLFTDVNIVETREDTAYDVEAFRTTKDGASERWLFEVKKVRVATRNLIRYFAPVATRLRERYPRARVVLVVVGSITLAATAAAKAQGFSVWDSTRLARLASNDPQLLLSYFGTPSIPSARDLKADGLRARLDGIQPGQAEWADYQRTVADILEYLFCPPLEQPQYEFSDRARRNRRDIIFENASPDGFWSQVRNVYDAHYVVVDAKNDVAPLKKISVLSIAHYLKPYGCGMFGVLVSRRGASAAARHAIREQWIGAKKLIVSIADTHLREMLQVKATGGKPEELLRRRIGDLRMRL